MAIALRPRPSASAISSRYGSQALALGARPGADGGRGSVDTSPVVAGFGFEEPGSVDTAVVVAGFGGHTRSGATIVSGMLFGLDRGAATELSFFLAMPTMAGAFALHLLEVTDYLAPERAAEIAVGFVMAFVASVIMVKPFLRFVSRSGFGSFAWYRIATRLAIPAALAAR